MTASPIQGIEQPSGFTFDSMDFAMSRSSICLIPESANTPTIEDWDDDDVEFEQYLHGDNDN